MGAPRVKNIVFFCYFGTVTQFGSLGVGLICFFCTVTQFGSLGGQKTNNIATVLQVVNLAQQDH